MVIGGNRQHVEADEIAFRCRPALVDNEERIEWIRYIAVARRGSAKIFMELLDQRFTGGAGQGGGGALSVEEFVRIFRVDSESPLMAKFSILHTDSAKAYKHTGPMYWAKPSANGFHDPDVVEVHHWSFRQLQHGWTHTSVCHKEKVGQPVQYAVTRTIRLHDGSCETCKCGTQAIDGFWASLRKHVGRCGVNTGDPDSMTRQRLHRLVREFQWHWWHLEKDRFPLFYGLVREHRLKRELPVF